MKEKKHSLWNCDCEKCKSKRLWLCLFGALSVIFLVCLNAGNFLPLYIILGILGTLMAVMFVDEFTERGFQK